MKVREAQIADLRQVVRIHQKAFRGFFMTDLGPRFLTAYYRAIMAYNHRLFLLCHDASGTIEGFVAGFHNPNEFYKQLRTKKWHLALCAGSHLAFRPRLWVRAMAGLRRVRDLAQSNTTGTVELASIAVAPEAQGKGIGTVLVHAFLEQAHRQGARKVYLTTDACNNDSVNAFYQRLGFRLARQFWQTKSRLMNEYEYIFTEKD